MQKKTPLTYLRRHHRPRNIAKRFFRTRRTPLLTTRDHSRGIRILQASHALRGCEKGARERGVRGHERWGLVVDDVQGVEDEWGDVCGGEEDAGHAVACEAGGDEVRGAVGDGADKGEGVCAPGFDWVGGVRLG